MHRFLCVGALGALVSCGLQSTAGGETVSSPSTEHSSSSGWGGSSSGATSSANQPSSSSQNAVLPLDYWVAIPAGVLERSPVNVTLDSFAMGQTEVTQGLFRQILGESPSLLERLDSLPVTHVSWFDAVRFCNALSKQLGLDTLYTYSAVGAGGVLLDLEGLSGVSGVRLPTEAEWEYAYRANTSTDYFWGQSLDAAFSYVHLFESGKTLGPRPVARLQSNPWGLFDMAGNVWEWVQDWYAPYDPYTTANPTGPVDGSERGVRGGGWASSVTDMQSNARFKRVPDFSDETLGFRVVQVYHGP